jgi:hypothetical protein
MDNWLRKSGVYSCIAGLFGKLPPNADFEEEEEEDESQSNQPCGNKYQRRLAGTQVTKQLTDCAHDDAVWQHSVDSVAHSPGNKRCSAGDCGSKQPAKCTQEFLASHHHSVNSTPKSDCDRNRRCSVQLLNGPVAWQRATGGNGLRARLLPLLS